MIMTATILSLMMGTDVMMGDRRHKYASSASAVREQQQLQLVHHTCNDAVL